MTQTFDSILAILCVAGAAWYMLRWYRRILDMLARMFAKTEPLLSCNADGQDHVQVSDSHHARPRSNERQ